MRETGTIKSLAAWIAVSVGTATFTFFTVLNETKVRVKPEDPRIARAAIVVSVDYSIDYKESHPIVSEVFKVAKSEGIDPYLILGIIAQESSFKPSAKSKVATGLMQIHKQHGYKETTLVQPDRSIQIGTVILSDFIKANKGDLDKALAGYSGGAKMYAIKVKANAYTIRYKSEVDK